MVRAQIILREEQRKVLAEIAKQENRSISNLIRGFLDEQIRVHEERQMFKAAELLKEDYMNDQELTVFTALDIEEFHEEG